MSDFQSRNQWKMVNMCRKWGVQWYDRKSKGPLQPAEIIGYVGTGRQISLPKHYHDNVPIGHWTRPLVMRSLSQFDGQSQLGAFGLFRQIAWLKSHLGRMISPLFSSSSLRGYKGCACAFDPVVATIFRPSICYPTLGTTIFFQLTRWVGTLNLMDMSLIVLNWSIGRIFGRIFRIHADLLIKKEVNEL